MTLHTLGIDVGGTGMKAAIVDTASGRLITERYKVFTPQPPTLQSMLGVLRHIIDYFDWRHKPIGCGFPAIIKKGRVLSAINIDDDWLEFDLQRWFEIDMGVKAKIINDADAAAIGETIYGAGRGQKGTTLTITLGTGVGSGLLRDRVLVPNVELGQICHQDHDTWEKYMSNRVRKTLDLSWSDWGARLDEYLHHIDFIMSPDQMIIGGGVSKKWDKYKDYITVDTDVRPATLGNNAGICGAAYLGGF